MIKQPTMQDKMEDIVDQYGLSEVLYWLQQICQDKADHLRTNWQNENSAADWEARYDLLYNTMEEMERIG
jgi:hypothetical protein